MTGQAGVVLAKDVTSRPATPLTWALSIVACVYCVYMGATLFYSTGVFINMFSSMGVDLPFLSRLVIGTYRFSYPVIFGGGSILVIAKQFYVREKWANISATFGTVLLVDS